MSMMLKKSKLKQAVAVSTEAHSQAQTVCASDDNRDTLARHFIDLLIENAGGRPCKMSQGKEGSYDKETSEFLADLSDPDEEALERTIGLSVDLAIAAVRLARAIEPQIKLIKALRKDAPIVVIETGDAAIHEEIEKVIGVCVLGSSSQTLGPANFDSVVSRRYGRAVAIFERTSALTGRDVSIWSKRVGRALQARYPIIGVAADPSTQLPRDLLRIFDYRIALEPLGASGVALVIEAVTGRAPTVPLDQDLARQIDLGDLRISLHVDRGADGSQEKLIEVVKRRLALTDVDPRLEDLFGFGAAREIALAIVHDLREYREGRIPWSAVDRGLLLSGPPGTGKTTFAKAMARSAGLPLVVGSLGQWQAAREGHLGHCLAAMRESFAEARAKAPCLFLIDELDSFGDRASFSADHKDYSVQVVNGLLESLDGVGGRQGVVVIGATNHAHFIDPAITRAGRLDRTVEIPLPDIEALAQILRFHLKGDLDGVDIKAAAVAARGGTGADCESWVRRARGAARRSARPLHFDDLLAAINEQRSSMPDHLRARVACHEAGHALVTMALSLGTPTSLSLHDWGGATEISAERRALTGRDILKSIAQFLAGREAERLIFDDITAGAGGAEQSDLARATKLAAAYEGSFGLGSLGPLWLGAPSEMTTIARLTAIGARVSKILEHAAQQALRALKTNQPLLERLSAALCDASYLDSADVTRLVGEISLIEIEPLPETNIESLDQAEPQGK